MKDKLTIDKLIASSQHNAAPPPPDPDLMWADMTKRLDAEAPSGSVPDSGILVGPAPAAAGKQLTTIIAWLLFGLVGIGALYALVSRQTAGSTEQTSMEMPVDNVSQLQQPGLTETASSGSSTAGADATGAGASWAVAAGSVQSEVVDHSVEANAPSGTGHLRPADAPSVKSQNTKGARTRPSATKTGATPQPADDAAFLPASTSATARGAAGRQAIAGSALAQEAYGLRASHEQAAASYPALDPAEMTPPLPQIRHEVALLPLPSALLEIPAPVVAWPTVEAPSRLTSQPVQCLVLYAGSSLGKTPRVYQNYTPALSYLNLGIGYRMSLSRRWSFQPELWWLQLETPRLSVVTEQRLDLDGERLLRYDTVSVMRMQGLGLNLMMGAELPAGFTLFGGPHLGRYAGVMTEQSSGTRSLVNGSFSWNSNYSRGYSAAPEWFQVYQAGMRLGIEKRFRQKVILGLSVYQGLNDLSRVRVSGPGNYSTSWVVYAGYRL
jgi:hypothetical protein